MYAQLLGFKKHISNWQTTIIALLYHDIIYDVKQHNNEQQSAAIIEERMQGILHSTDIKKATELILATQTHSMSEEQNINLFTDADLSILGTSPHAYMQYAENIRKKYCISPQRTILSRQNEGFGTLPE